jgi:putative hydrolase of the HAD superfamily
VTPIEGVICDFGGVLTAPLGQAFAAMQEESGISNRVLGEAMARMAAQDGAHPLFELEKGSLSERDFLAALAAELTRELGREIDLHGFGETYFDKLDPNHELIDYMRTLRDRGLRMAILTNNVREWEPLWRAKLPVDEIFELVVDSAFVGMRKPDPEIYRLTLERLGLPARACVFVDDTDVNCEAARELGLTAVWFRSNPQAIAEVEAALSGVRAGD